jgi:hypothetical protein
MNVSENKLLQNQVAVQPPSIEPPNEGKALHDPQVSKVIEAIQDRFPQLSNIQIDINTFACSLIVAGALFGTYYAFANEDIVAGGAIFQSSATLVSLATAIIQGLRGKPRDAGMWLLATIACYAVGLSILKDQATNEAKDSQLSTELKNDHDRLQNCRAIELSSSAADVNRITCPQLEKAKELIDQNQLRYAKHALNGHTPTYFFRDEALVIQDNFEDPWTRTSKMELAADLVRKNGFQHIEIAKASVYQNYVVQSLLPIECQKAAQCMGLYFYNVESFTEVVQELTSLFIHLYHDDINSYKAEVPGGFMFSHPLPRFDNLAPFIENGVGKVAIPDLDDCSLMEPIKQAGITSFFSKDKYAELRHIGIKNIIRFFPYHYNEIMEEAKKHLPYIDTNDPAFTSVRDEARNHYETIYLTHLRHINKLGITAENINTIPEISPELNDKIQNATNEWLCDLLLSDTPAEMEKLSSTLGLSQEANRILSSSNNDLAELKEFFYIRTVGEMKKNLKINTLEEKEELQHRMNTLFKDSNIVSKLRNLLIEELNEQVAKKGADPISKNELSSVRTLAYNYYKDVAPHSFADISREVEGLLRELLKEYGNNKNIVNLYMKAILLQFEKFGIIAKAGIAYNRVLLLI